MDNNTKLEFAHNIGFAAFIGVISIFLALGSKVDIQYWATHIVLYGYMISVVIIFMIRTYIGSVKLTEIKVDKDGKRFDLVTLLSMGNTGSALFVELATLTWTFVSFFAVGGGIETDTYRHIHPFEQFSTYLVVPYLAFVVNFSLNSMIKGRKITELTPIGIKIKRR